MPLMQPQEIQTRFQMLPDNLKNGVMANDLAAMENAINQAQLQSAVANNPNDPARNWQNTMKETLNNVKDLQQGNVGQVMAKSKFNLKRYAQSAFPTATPTDPFGAEMNPAGYEAEQSYMQSDPIESGGENHFASHQEVAQLLDSYGSLENARNSNPDLVNAITGSEVAQGAIDRYYTETNAEMKLDLAELIYENLPVNMKNQQANLSNPQEGINMPAEYKKLSFKEYLDGITASIRKVAEEVGKSKQDNSRKFNLLKTAQHLTSKDLIMWGPGQTRPDPFLMGKPVSDWHIIERNKGFGQDIDGVWNIDWEAVWRGNVMDKYSRPYRDTTTGEWVGGYIQKRFEVDKWIPETNNYQLLPGERRKPILPEYGNTESRLQALRHKNDGKLGKVYNDTSKPFNWHEAKSKQNIKTAELGNHPLKFEVSGDAINRPELTEPVTVSYFFYAPNAHDAQMNQGGSDSSVDIQSIAVPGQFGIEELDPGKFDPQIIHNLKEEIYENERVNAIPNDPYDDMTGQDLDMAHNPYAGPDPMERQYQSKDEVKTADLKKKQLG